MLTLYHAPHSRSGRTLWLLEELGVDYDIRYVNIRYGDGSGARDAANVHPDGKVPALVHDGALVTEGLAIALYLTDVFDRGMVGVPVGDAKRGEYLTWLAWNAGELEPALFAGLHGPKDDPRVQASLVAAFARISAALARGDWLMGERFTAVDVMIGSALQWARAALPESAVLDAYLARLADRPSFATAQAKDAPRATATSAVADVRR